MYTQFTEQPVAYVKGVGPVKADALKKELEIFTFGDLLTYYPYRYVDRSRFHTISEINEEGAYVQIAGRVVGIQAHGEKRKTRLNVLFQDKTGTIELIWFQGIKWITEKLVTGADYVIFGRVSSFNNRYNIPHPEVESLAEFRSSPKDTFHPLYNTTEKMKAKGLDSKGMARILKNLMETRGWAVSETLPDWLIRRLKLMPLEDALKKVHFPSTQDEMEKARLRLKYDELLFIQLHLLALKHSRYQKVKGYRFDKVGEMFRKFYDEKLPFALTGAQKKVVREIRVDMGSGRHMNRLLQGDVGSGKTLVALMAALIAMGNGFQATIMAPTEILAGQHLRTISSLIDGLGINVALLTGSTKAAARKKLLKELESGELQLLIGTHALIEDRVVFKNLGVAIIDEQHRFGVEQRARLWAKNVMPPHVLVMTATPIPRTLAMTLYGDLDLSVIDELPPGRKPIKTVHSWDGKRNSVFDFMRQQIHSGRQVYVVYPLIEESEKLDLKDLMDGFESISRAFPLPQYAVSIVHGKMNPVDKAYEMNRFVKGETQIMVSTTVIEVGVDVPNASVMVIENAERFGLSQLHQLRGRVGRGAEQSWCILMTSQKLTVDGRKRIATMVNSNDGFVIADVDLSLRGPGDLQGTRQSGLPDLKIANLVKDEKIMRHAREMAMSITEKDPQLVAPENRILKETLRRKFKDEAIYAVVG